MSPGLYTGLVRLRQPELPPKAKAKYKPTLTMTMRLLLWARRLRRWLAHTITTGASTIAEDGK